MSTFTIILLIIILVLTASDVYFLWRISRKVGRRKKNKLPDERYFELKYNINLLKAVSAILIFLLGFLGFTTYRDITSIVESDFEEKFEVQEEKIRALDSIVTNYEGLVESLKSEEGKSIENLNDVKREFGLINKKVAQTQEALRHTTKIYVISNLLFNTDKEGIKTQKYWFNKLETVYGENLPKFEKPPLIITQSRDGISLIVKEITNEYVELKASQETRMLYYTELENKPNHYFEMWIAEPKPN